jgi:hypothetical protein
MKNMYGHCRWGERWEKVSAPEKLSVQKKISFNDFEKCIVHGKCLKYYELNKEMPTLQKLLLFIKN